ncbi:MAG: efflux RND transporter permease subunit [Spirochaetes bacterium]|nr:efflux RND transporter permease subunit [Spirochaetota bacterium]
MKSLRELETTVFNRVNPAINFSVTRYVLAIGIFVAIVVFGIISMLGLGVDLLPAVNIPTVQVITSFPGATPNVIDQQVTQPIENLLSSLSGITDISSTSSIGSSRVSISFDVASDRTAVANRVASLVAGAVRRLPAGVNPPTVQTFDPNSQPILQFGISGGATSLADVAAYVQNTLTPALELVPGVANISVDGAPTRQFQVLLDPNKLQYYNLVPAQVVAAITNSAVSSPIGSIVSQGNSLTFSTQNVPSTITAIDRTLVDPSRGIAVDDIGSVRDVPTPTNFARVNGTPLILVSVQRTTDSNAVAVVQSVRTMLKATTLPEGYTLTFSNDTTGPIRASIDSTYRELAITTLVVALIVLLFLGKLNTAVSVILAIPIALSAAPILYSFAGFSFNLVSLLALIIAIGIVVDDSIVVAENVERYQKMGFGIKESVLKGASEVFSAVVAATLSLLAVLLPVSFIGGFIGRYLQQFSLGLAAAVAFSLLEAILFLTVRLAYTAESRTLMWSDFFHSWSQLPDALRWGWKTWRKGFGILLGLAIAGGAWVLTRHWYYVAAIVAYPLALGVASYAGRIVLTLLQALTTTLHGWTEAGLEWVRDAYTRGLGAILRQSRWVLIGAAAFLVASAAIIVPRLPFNFVPQTDSGVIGVNVRLPSGTPNNVANLDAAIVERYLLEQPEVVTVQTVVGTSGQMTVQLVQIGKRPGVAALTTQYRRDISALFRDQPSVQISVNAGGGGFGGFGGSSLQFSIVAADYNMLLARNDAIIQQLQANQWVADVTSSLSQVRLQSDFIPDASKLKGTGITPNQIAQALQTYTTGSQASNVVTGGLSYPIQVLANPTTITGGQSLLNMPIYSPALGTTIRVGQLGSFVLTQAPVSLSRDNRQYTGEISLSLRPNAPTALTLQNQIQAELTQSGLVGGNVTLAASSRFSQTALASQLASSGPVIFLLALFLTYLVMAAQFNSWRYPIYLLLPVPLALVGALWLVYIMGGGLDIFGLMGMLMLIGLSAKNAILYLDFVVERIGKMPFKDALIEAARLRFRPIVMTTLTVLVISFPLIFGRGQGSEFGQRMGVVMLGGIVFSAVLTFFVVPSAFYLFERVRVAKVEAPKEPDPVAAAARES